MRIVFFAVISFLAVGCDVQTTENDKTASFQSGEAVQNDYAISDEDDGMSSGTSRTPVRKGRWDPAPRKMYPLKGSSRQRQLKYTAMINAEAKRAGIDPRFIHAIISQESKYNTNARSHAGAEGLMQIMPATARQLKLPPSQRRSHPRKNVRAGIKYFTWMKWANGNLQALAAGYNSGPARAKALLHRNTRSQYWRGSQPSSSNGVPSQKFWGGETYNYARNVAGYFELYSANPHLIGLGVTTGTPSTCRARGLC